MKKYALAPLLGSILLVGLLVGCRKSFTDESLLPSSSNSTGAMAENTGINSAAFIPGEVLVEFRDAEDPAAIAGVGGAVAERVRTKAMERFNQRGFAILKVPEVAAAVEQLQRNPKVRWVSPNYVVRAIQAYPDDPYFTANQLWGLNNIHANAVWPLNKGSQNVYIGLIDEGIMYWHEDLCGQIWNNPYDPEDGVDNDQNGYVDDSHGWDFYHNDKTIFDNSDNHGTHTAGTIGAKGNNAKGVIGVAPYVTIISAKFLQGSGSIANGIKATDYITDLKLRHNLNVGATSNSWGWSGGGFVQGMYDAIDRARQAGILFVAAAGNDAADNDVAKFYPSSMTNDNVISVASITSSDLLSSFSCYGLTTVDLGAPGSGIWSTLPGASNSSTYGSYSGTSMATPHVSGAVALYKAIYPAATYQQVKNAILSNVRTLPALQGKSVTGGVLDVTAFAVSVSETPQDRPCPVPGIDAIPPTDPTNLAASGVTASSISLSWTASSDNVGVAGYRVYWKPTTSGTYQMATTATNSYTKTGLAASTGYNFYVVAYDAAGNLSGSSATLTQSTLAAAPTIATKLVASAASGVHNLRWTITTTGTLSQVVLEAKRDNLAFATVYTAPLTKAGNYSYTPSVSGKYTYRVFVRVSEGTTGYSNSVVVNKK